jgi:type IV pilus assembly protein PilM
VDKRDETSIWKKEITFRRKPKEAKFEVPPPAKPEETSVWKKEISLRRKPQAPKAEARAVSKPEETSVWKKEISFRRKPKADPAATVRAELLHPTQYESPLPEYDTALDPLLPPVTASAEPTPAPPASAWVPSSVTEPIAPEAESEPPAVPEPVSRETPALEEPVAGEPFVEFDLPPVSPPAQPPSGTPSPWASPVTSPSDPSGEEAPRHELEPEQEPESAPFEITLPAVTSHAEPQRELPASAWVPPVELESSPQPSTREAEQQELAAEVQGPTTDGETMSLVPPPEIKEEETPTPSRRDRRDARRAVDRQAKERKAGAAQIAKEQRKANPSMHTRVVGLKLGASQIAAAEVINKGGPRVVRMARTPLARGVIVGGELREPDELAAALKTFFRKNKLSRSCVRLGVSNNRIGVRTFEIAGIEDEKQLANAIRFRAQETLPIPLDEAVLDYRVLDDRLNEEGVRIRRVLLVVAHRDLVERYVAACRKAGLKLIGIDLDAFALLRALADPAAPPAEDAGVVCITIGHDRSTLAVSNGRVCEFTRVLSWGGFALDAALARVLDLTPSAAEPIRRELSLDEEGEATGLDAAEAAEARNAIAAELQIFAREIVASLRFYQEQPNSLGISEIMITGGTAATSGLSAELERLIGIPVRVADPLMRVKLPRKLRNAHDDVGSLAVAVGLGIED